MQEQTQENLSEAIIHAAIDEMIAKGMKTTIAEIRKYLGRGSDSTINKYKRTWQSGNMEKQATPEIPADVQKIANKYTLDMWRYMSIMVNDCKLLANKKIEDIQSDLDGVLKHNNELEKVLLQKLTENRVLNDEIELLKTENNRLRSVEADNLVLQKTIIELKNSLSVANERENSLNQSLITVTKENQDLSSAKVKLVGRESEVAKLTMQVANHQAIIDSLKKREDELKEDLNQARVSEKKALADKYELAGQNTQLAKEAKQAREDLKNAFKKFQQDLA